MTEMYRTPKSHALSEPTSSTPASVGEADPVVPPQDIYLPSLACGMEVEASAGGDEVHRHHVGPVSVGEAEPADERFAKSRGEQCGVGDLLILSSHC